MSDSGVTLWNGDCLDLMRDIPDASVDLIAADLPYGTTACKWDVVIPFELLWQHYKRVLKPKGAVVLTASQPFTSQLVMSNPKWFRFDDVWEKDRATGVLDANRRPLRAHESILIFSPAAPCYRPQKVAASRANVDGRRNGRAAVYCGDLTRSRANPEERYPRSVIKINVPNGHERGLHPTQKPVALMEYLLRTYSHPGDLVLDNSMGSGTTLVAAINTGRRCIGIELDPAIFATARARLDAHIAATPLFAGVAS